MTLPARTAVIAVGGNALIRARQRGTIQEQFEDALAGRTGTHVVAG